MRVLFMGTPEFAVPSLRALLGGGNRVCGVFTQPDRPKNRGMKLQPTPVKALALEAGVPVFQPQTLRDGEAMAHLRALEPELIVVAAYGRLLPDEILDYPARGCINVHSSLLPKYRGAAPINWAVLNGEEETGVSVMHMAAQLDAGDIIAQAATPIGPEEDAMALYDRLAGLGGELLADTVEKIAAGTAGRTPQDPEKATLAPMLSKALSPVDWSRSAQAVHDQIRGLIPWPMAVAQLDGVRCKLWASRVCEETTHKAPGSVVQADRGGLKLACGGGSVLRLTQLQPDGKRRMSAEAFLAGHPIARA